MAKTTGNNKKTSPRVIKGAKKTDDSLKGNYWKSIDPVIPIIQVDWQRPGTDNTSKRDGYNTKKRKTDPKKNGNWF